VRERRTIAVGCTGSVWRADCDVVKFLSKPTFGVVYAVVLAVRDIDNWSRGRLFLFGLRGGPGSQTTQRKVGRGLL
jgi:hypothetical protein